MPKMPCKKCLSYCEKLKKKKGKLNQVPGSCPKISPSNKKYVCGGQSQFLPVAGSVEGCCEHGHGPSGSIKGGEFCDYLCCCNLLAEFVKERKYRKLF
jgi:hypothetical protein